MVAAYYVFLGASGARPPSGQITLPKPAAVIAGDLVVWSSWIIGSAITGDVVPPEFIVPLTAGNVGGSDTVVVAGLVAGASEPSSYTTNFAGTPITLRTGIIAAYRAVDPAAVFAWGTQHSASTPAQIPGTALPKGLEFIVWISGDTVTDPHPPAGVTSRFANGFGMIIADVPVPPDGSLPAYIATNNPGPFNIGIAQTTAPPSGPGRGYGIVEAAPAVGP